MRLTIFCIRRLITHWLLCCCCLTFSAAGLAQAPHLFTASVPIERSDVASTNAGKKAAFARVLVRLSGQTATIDHEAIRVALTKPDAYVNRYQYVRKSTPASADEQLFIEVSFEPQQVIGLLRGVQLPVWDQPRQRVLVWVVVDDQGSRYVINAAAQPEYSAILLDQADYRGLEILLPLMDLADLAYVDADVIYQGSSNPLRLAAARYDSEVMSVIRMQRTPEQEWQIRWEYWQENEPVARFGTTATRTSALRLGIDWMADQIASKQLPKEEARPVSRISRGKWIQVNSVPDFISYAEVVDFFKQVNGVVGIHLVRIADQSILLSVRGDVTWGQLLSVVRLNNRLIELEDSNATVLRLAWRG